MVRKACPVCMRFIFFAGLLLHTNFASSQEFRILPKPKNIIFLISDGMGYNQVKATDYYSGLKAQPYELFPVKLAVATYPALAGEYDPRNFDSLYPSAGYNPSLAWKDTAYLKMNVTESAAAATAMSTGIKTYNYSIGLGVNHDTLVNLVQVAKALGKSAGVVTTVELSHATPAGFVAHNITRNNYPEIASEMLFDSRCDVIMGCGNPQYDDEGQRLTLKWNNARYVVDSTLWVQFLKGTGKETEFVVKGKKKTVRDIDGDQIPDPWTVITSKEDFRKLASGKIVKRVLGCPEIYSTLQQSRSMKNGETKNSPPFTTPFVSTVPSIDEMELGALNVLNQNKNGFFLMAEAGGAVDWACHENQKGRMIEEQKSFNDAVNTVIEWIEKYSNWDETLLIVTGDHECGNLWGGAPFAPVLDHGRGHLPEMQFNSIHHTNVLIPLFAKGCGAELLNIMADEQDPVRGPFIGNSEIAQLIFFLWGKPAVDLPVIAR